MGIGFSGFADMGNRVFVCFFVFFVFLGFGVLLYRGSVVLLFLVVHRA